MKPPGWEVGRVEHALDYRSPGMSGPPAKVARLLDTVLGALAGSTSGSTPSTTDSSVSSLTLPKGNVRTYSPTETKDWLTCPRFRHLKRTWEPRENEWTPNKLMGTAVGDALSVAYRNWSRVNETEILKLVMDTCDKVLKDGFVEGGKWTLPGLQRIAIGVLKAGLEEDLIGQSQVLLVDEDLGGARPDLVLRHPTQGIVIWDTKVTWSLNPKYEASRLAEYDCDHQFWDYAWRVGEYLGEPVSWTGAHLLVATPKVRSLRAPVKVTPERLAFWLEGAEWAWSQMEQEDLKVTGNPGSSPPRWTSCYGKFGRCPYFDICHTFHGNPEQVEVFFDRRER